MPNEKDPKENPSGNSNGDDSNKGEANEGNKGGVDVESLKKSLEEKDKLIENLKKGQSETTKTLNEIKSNFDSLQGKFKEAGIDSSGLDKIIKENSRNATIFKTVSELNVNPKLIQFIKGDTEDEIKSSIKSIQSVIEEEVAKVKELTIKEIEKKKDFKPNPNEAGSPQAVDLKSQASSFLQNTGLVKKQ